MAGNRKRISLDDNECPCSTTSGRLISSEPEVPACPSKTSESSNDSRDVIVIDSDIEEVVMRGNRKRVSLWTDDNESPSCKFRRLDVLEKQTWSEPEVSAGPSRALESDNGSQDVIIIDSDTEEDDVILTGVTYPNGKYVNMRGEERRRRRESRERKWMSSSASHTDTAAATAEIEVEEMTVNSLCENFGEETMREAEGIEDGKYEMAIIERGHQPARAVSNANNGDVEDDLIDIETVDDDMPETGTSSILHEEDFLSEDLSIEDEDPDDEDDRREDSGEENGSEENAEEEAANEDEEWEINAPGIHEEYDAEQEDFMYTFDVPEILWEAGFDLLEDFFQLGDPEEGEEFFDDDSSQSVFNGLSQQEIDNFPTKRLTECDCNSESTSKCIICLNDFESDDVVRTLKPCDHEFHQDCIDEWLKCHKTCPLCRTYVDDWGISLN